MKLFNLFKNAPPITRAVIALLAFGSISQAETILVDLGNESSFRGANVTSPDTNGNSWNSIWAGVFNANLVDTNGDPTAVDFGFSGETGTDYFNGPSGATQDPTATDYDAAALGDLGIDEAVYDYYVNPQFEIQQLDPNSLYTLTFYGSHKFNANPTTEFRVYTDNTYTTLVDSATLDVHQPGSPWLHNRDAVATISGLSPQAFNILYVQVSGLGGGDGYLNAMKIEAVEIPEPTALTFMVGLGVLGISAQRRS